MRESVQEKVSVVLVYDRARGKALPARLRWNGREYTVDEVGFHHPVREGRALHHVFSVTAGGTFFRLDLDAETLHWTLTEVSDGLPD
jgi:hypothetical protein